LSHLARLPFSIVGDSAGIRMLMGILTSQDILAGCLPDPQEADQRSLGVTATR
jgi:hypothetical protein